MYLLFWPQYLRFENLVCVQNVLVRVRGPSNLLTLQSGPSKSYIINYPIEYYHIRHGTTKSKLDIVFELKLQ